MLVEAFHVYRMLAETRDINNEEMTFYYFIGWGKIVFDICIIDWMYFRDLKTLAFDALYEYQAQSGDRLQSISSTTMHFMLPEAWPLYP